MHIQKNVFLLYSQRKISIGRAANEKIDTEIFASLPRNSRGYVTSKFRTDENSFRNHHLLVEILSKSFEDSIEIKKGQAIVFFVAEPENLKSDFAYAGRDVNQAAKVAVGVIKGATKEIDNNTQCRINQIISQEGKEVECVIPKVLRGAIEDIYQTPF